MELEEQNDPKIRLLRKSAMHREQLEDEVKHISDRTERILTNALIIGGTLVATYMIMRIFTSSDDRKRKTQKVKVVRAEVDATRPVVEEEEESTGGSVLAQVGTAVATQAALLLLDLAKEKLTEYIQSQALHNKEDDGRP